MIPSVGSSCFQANSHGFQMYGGMEDMASNSSSAAAAAGSSDAHSQTLLYNLAILRDRVQQVQSVVSMVVSPPDPMNQESTAVAVSGAGTLIQDIIVAASSMLYAFQQVALGSGVIGASGADDMPHHHHHHHQQHHHHMSKASYEGSSRHGNGIIDHVLSMEGGRRSAVFAGGGEAAHYNHNTANTTMPGVASVTSGDDDHEHFKKQKLSSLAAAANEYGKSKEPSEVSPSTTSDIIELDATDLLAKYTHYCHVCGKGFKRDANLRMHMRAHGDKYKTNAALTNPSKGGGMSAMHKENPETSAGSSTAARKYSCPQEGCRWNKKHAKFQPLKSMICVKNHYKRSHCPKMYVCNRCNLKQFSVLSDLRTHEKHCGALKWQCSCGTTFSRKDKLMGHVALFAGHAPVVSGSFAKQGKKQQYHGFQIKIDGR